MELLENNFGKTRCTACDSVFKADHNDLKTDIDGDAYVECPVCEQRLYLSEKEYEWIKKDWNFPHR